MRFTGVLVKKLLTKPMLNFCCQPNILDEFGCLNRWEDFLRRFNTNTSHKKNGSMDAAWPAKGQKDTYLEEVILNAKFSSNLLGTRV